VYPQGPLRGLVRWTAIVSILVSTFALFYRFAPNLRRTSGGGAFPTPAPVLLWLYLTSAAVLVGAELNSEIENAREAIAAEGGSGSEQAGRRGPQAKRSGLRIESDG